MENFDLVLPSTINSPISSSFILEANEISSLSPSSSEITAPQQQVVFEASMPDMSVMIGMGTVFLLCVVAGSVWANSVVPVSRAKLAVSKSRGEVKEYLDEIREDENGERGFEKWLFSDWLNKSPQKKDPAIPFLKPAKWNSGDNPVLVTAALMGVGVIIASFTERVSAGGSLF